jgi:uncharacterized coiled-coil DUF342 family protein
MKKFNWLVMVFLVAVMVLGWSGCKKESTPAKTPAEVKAEVEKMDVDQLRSKALDYKKQIMAKQEEIAKVSEKLKGIPVAEVLGDEAKKLKGEVDQLSKAMKELTSHFQVYYDQLKANKGDLSGLEL